MHTEERFSSAAICLDIMKICCCKEAYAKLINFMDAPCDKKCDIPAAGPTMHHVCLASSLEQIKIIFNNLIGKQACLLTIPPVNFDTKAHCAIRSQESLRCKHSMCLK